MARKARRIRRIELALLLMTDHKQIKRSIAQILFRYNKGNGYGGAVGITRGMVTVALFAWADLMLYSGS